MADNNDYYEQTYTKSGAIQILTMPTFKRELDSAS